MPALHQPGGSPSNVEARNAPARVRGNLRLDHQTHDNCAHTYRLKARLSKRFSKPFIKVPWTRCTRATGSILGRCIGGTALAHSSLRFQPFLSTWCRSGLVAEATTSASDDKLAVGSHFNEIKGMRKRLFGLGLLTASLVGCALQQTGVKTHYDVIIRNGTIYDGGGQAPFVADLAINGETIATIGKLKNQRGKIDVDAKGLAVAPGFINMLSWATESLIHDGRSQSDIRQGVTLEIFGEGESMGPLNEAMKKEMVEQQGDIKYSVEWTTLGEYLDSLVQRGVSCNVASFVGATTVRIHEIGYADRAPTPEELVRMKRLVRQAMEEGALGVGSSLIYAPAFYAKTDELIELCKVAAEYGGMYISHLRSEGNRFLQALDEMIAIAREANVAAEVYHLKAAGESNWGKLDAAIRKIETARAAGLRITADMYTYTAGQTGLDAAMPPWVQEGGFKAWAERLKDPNIRERVKREMATPTDEWENFFEIGRAHV